MKYVLISDPPAPWREPVFEMVHRQLGDDFHVVYFGDREKRRLWSFRLGSHPKTVLPSVSVHLGDRGERFVNPGIVPFLLKHRPKIAICFGVYPTSLIAHLVLRVLGSKVIVFADTWLGRDTNLSVDQKIVRRIIYGTWGRTYIGASEQTLRMFRHYNKRADHRAMFLSSLCADNDYFRSVLSGTLVQRRYDLLFCGRIVSTKNPLFFGTVVAEVRKRRGACSVLVVGDGDEELKRRWFADMEKNQVDYEYVGFVSHEQLPGYYAKARLLLLPTSGDCWGVVINEAMVSGVPVITTDRTAAAGELVMHEQNGYVLPLETQAWVNRICALLDDPNMLHRFSSRAREDVQRFNFARAAQGIVDAVRYVERTPAH